MDAILNWIWISLISFVEWVQHHIFPVFHYLRAESMRADCSIQPILIYWQVIEQTKIRYVNEGEKKNPKNVIRMICNKCIVNGSAEEPVNDKVNRQTANVLKLLSLLILFFFLFSYLSIIQPKLIQHEYFTSETIYCDKVHLDYVLTARDFVRQFPMVLYQCSQLGQFAVVLLIATHRQLVLLRLKIGFFSRKKQRKTVNNNK